MTGTVEDLLTQWLPSQRWYPRKGTSGDGARVRIVDSFELPAGVGPGSADAGAAPKVAFAPTAAFLVLLVGIDFPAQAAAQSLLLQVPVTVRAGAAASALSGDSAKPIHIGTLGGEASGAAGSKLPGLGAGAELFDGLSDANFVRAWLASLGRGQEPDADGGQGLALWLNPDFAALDTSMATNVRTIATEQSNTSVMFSLGDKALIAKFFRVLHAGSHPEQDIGQALAELPTAGSALNVPALQASGAWGAQRTTLFVIHDFIQGASDGWTLALDHAQRGIDFTPHAAAIGAALAHVHAALAQSMGSTTPDGAAATAFVQALQDRLEAAWEVAGSAVGLDQAHWNSFLTQLGQITQVPAMQRIHGDLHLGQLLHRDSSAGGDWFILDFEGEPLRPLAERSTPDAALRDVAGMLRSFDYAGAQAQGMSAQDRSRWVQGASQAFLAAYGSASGEHLDADSPLLQALLLDKALYEVVYELQNRPDWVRVPLEAVRVLLKSTESDVDMGLGEATPLEVETEVLERVSGGTHYAPHSVLGAHLDGADRVTIRTLRHLAEAVTVVTADGEYPMHHEHGGIWVAVVPAPDSGHVPDYRLDVSYHGTVHRTDDPYRYLPTVGELDLHLMAEGRHETLWTVLGAHVRRYHSSMGEVAGVSFALWVPGVQAVRVIGEFNGWDGRGHGMRTLGSSGIWELFIPDVAAGASYKYEILTGDGRWLEKADPMAYGTEVPPLTASRVVESSYSFKDDAWMAKRAETDPHNSPMSVYEVHLGSWRPGLSYTELATELVEYVADLGFTHVELMPVAEHPFGGSWGYQVTSYYAPTSRFGHPDEFRHLVDALHQAGVGVIMDWVPAHFPKDAWALAKFNGGPQYEHANPQLGEHPDWGTLIFDFGRNEVRNFLVANALYWFEEFHIDGLRVDAVASMLYLDYSRNEGAWSPNRHGGRENLEAITFLQEMNATAYKRNPGIVTIAEESTAFPGVTAPTSEGGLGFGIKWNMGWMHDSLAYVAEDPINRGWHHSQITFSMVYAFTENFLLPISHDEVVHGKGSLLRKMPGDRWQQLANLRSYLAFQWAHPGKQLIFMGTEFGQESEWSEQYGLDWWLAEDPAHGGVQRMIRELNDRYTSTPALYEQDNVPAGFNWLNGGDTKNTVLSFIRLDKAGNPLVCIVNFAGVAYEGYRVGLPAAGAWKEAFNTDLSEYGGSNVHNEGPMAAEAKEWDGQEHSVTLRIPPLGTLYLVPEKTAAEQALPASTVAGQREE
ncbi:1,4-alpha-glucan branching protein GlgB [Specibacter sp. NPDC057265]|uniref:1,4-alpha-glucan branching protein GlgB n=1 Tax=Specibacter sp. NPDC057265 TaxID=3346075 RepID=UPI0036427A34